MKKIVLAVVAALALAAPAVAAEMPVKAAKAPVAAPSPWEIALGAAVVSDYNFRGISQSNKKPSIWGYVEPRFNLNPNLQVYVGAAYESIDFPNRVKSEVDFYAGIRPTFGPVQFDFGVWYYWYPGGTTYTGLGTAATCTTGVLVPCNSAKGNMSFAEIYGKATWTVNDVVALGANVFYDPNWMNTGAPGTYYSGTAKVTVPAAMLAKDWGAYVSGELGRYSFGTTDAFYGTIKLPAYTTWNFGVGATYKVFTVDLRYYDTDLSKGNCNVLTGDQGATFSAAAISAINTNGGESKWCSSTVILKLAVDTTIK